MTSTGAGELTISGKGSTSQLPLPHYVGDALVSYLRDGRPLSSGSREVFLRARAPHGALSPTGVRSVVHHACDRAGVQRIGAHRLRHTVATELLRAGVPLAQIAPILRHASVSSTAIYAKVDRVALRSLARPWPLADGAA
ncbi:MAG: tyrosine-type recombinase/integrase [Solirubrobacteraceae bacterium]|jgi:site-specific recombinase XerD